MYSEADFLALNAWMSAQFVAAGSALAAPTSVPINPRVGRETYRSRATAGSRLRECCCKPRAELQLDLSRSVMFGDKRTISKPRRLHTFRARLAGQKMESRCLPPIDGTFAARAFVRSQTASQPQLWALLGEASQPERPGFEHKIVARAGLRHVSPELARPIVLTNGVFDILHRGHVTS